MVRSGILLPTFFVLLLFSVNPVNAQNVPDEGSVGLTASFQGQGLDIQVPYWIQQNLVLAPLAGIQSVENNYTRIRLGVKPKFYQTIGNDFASYFSGLVAFEHFDPAAGDSDVTVNLGGGFGGEYFFSSHFSLGVEALLDIRLNGQNSLRTGAALNGSIYF